MLFCKLDKFVILAATALLAFSSNAQSFKLPKAHNAEHQGLIAKQENIGNQISVEETKAFVDNLFKEEEEPEPPVRMQNIDYLSLVGEIQYRFHPKWQLFAKGMYESASIYKAYDAYEKGKYRTAWGYQGGLEFYPMADDNLHIFLTAIGKKYNLSERAKALDASLDDTARLSIGFIYRLPLY